ncbi:hypothetical protein BDW22DRAFT_1484797 [Trametopsis cervina]|nr:hypothetical protein BDW22DRAFT_1484797 [Trametopsis cervina]
MWLEAHRVALLFLSLLHVLVLGQLEGSATLWTSFVPLAVRSPYLSAWMDTSNVPLNTANPSDPGTARAPSIWPVFYQNNAILGWAGLIRIDNETFKFLGDPGVPGGLNRSVLTNIQLTPTRTIMNMTAGPIDLVLTFLSPIEPSDLAAQSLPFSYMSLQARTNDGQSHSVQVYSDISAEWSSGDRGQQVNWNVFVSDQVILHQQQLVIPVPFGETGSQAVDATTFYGALQGPAVTRMADTDATCRNQFASSGNLTNGEKSGPDIINNPFDVFAIAQDLGIISGSFTSPVVWAVGMLRDPAIMYIKPDGTTQQRDPFWKSVHPTQREAATTFLTDFPNAFQRAVTLDAAILKDATQISSQYADLVSLTARQAMAGTEITIGPNDPGDVKMFMKDISGSSPARVTPVEVLYASFPAFLYVNASYGGYLLEPILEYSNSTLWTFPYAPKDLGTAYPNATGDNLPHTQEVEQTGNMLIMALAYAQASGDGVILSKYYNLFKAWGDYLVNNTLPVPSTQLTADLISKANSTNLAIKGIIGIKAMAEISKVLDKQSDSEHYSDTATLYAGTWTSLALSADTADPQHVISNYGASSSSWSLAYNLFADKWLRTSLIPDSVYHNEASFLQSLSANNPNGIAIDSDSATLTSPTGNTAWTLFAAASLNAADSLVRDGLISPIWIHASQNNSKTIFPTKFSLSTAGGAVDNVASPGVGGIFAPLALTIPNVTITTSPGPSATSSPAQTQTKKPNVGAIVGGVIAGIVGLGLILFLIFFFWRRSRAAQGDHVENAIKPQDLTPQPFPYRTAAYEPPVGAAIQPDERPSPSNSRTRESGLPTSPYPSLKAREAAGSRHTPAASSGYTSSTAPNSSTNPPTSPPSSHSRGETSVSSPISPREVIGLRVEVENLRRVMQSFQNDRLDPPPGYDGST